LLYRLVNTGAGLAPMTGAVVASLAGFRYWYPNSQTPALDGIDLDIDGGLTLVAGASGSGKSSLLRVFNGLVPHFHGGTVGGSAWVCDHDVITTPTRVLATRVGFVFQDPELQSVYAGVDRDVAFGLENIGVATAAMPARVSEALEQTGISHLRGRAVATLSGGERQRLALAGVLAMRPRLLVLDEPLAQLDEEGAAVLVATLGELVRAGTAVVVAEHRLEHLGALPGRHLTMHDGCLVEGVGDRVGLEVQPCHAALPTAPGPRPDTVAWRLTGVATGPARTPILEGLSLEGRAGEVVALVGPNGGGKTTLLRTIAGLLTPIAGTVERTAGRIAFLPQNPMSLLHRPSVAAEVVWTVRADKSSRDVAAILGALGLTHLAGRDPRDLSSGERQRAAIAAVLAGNPGIALLDEPTRGMDDAARDSLSRVVGKMRAAGCSIVLATHDKQLAEALADRTVMVGAGGARERTPVAAA
jgi:energy-coupling factor transport system ATP-binding protein